MTKTRFTVEITTPAPLLPDQRRNLINMIAQQLKELEFGDRPLGNSVHRAFILEQDE